MFQGWFAQSPPWSSGHRARSGETPQIVSHHAPEQKGEDYGTGRMEVIGKLEVLDMEHGANPSCRRTKDDVEQVMRHMTNEGPTYCAMRLCKMPDANKNPKMK